MNLRTFVPFVFTTSKINRHFFALVGLALTPANLLAQTDLYIAEYEYQRAQISAVGIDGTNSRTLFLLPTSQWLPIGLAFNPSNSRLYWQDAVFGSSFIRAANLDGSSPVAVTPLTGVGRGASLDALGRIYYTINDSVQRVNANGTGVVTLYTSTVPNLTGMPRVDATNGHVYVGSNGNIVRFDLDGTNVKTIVRGMSFARAISLDVASGHIYWTDNDPHCDYIGRARLDGSEFTYFIDNTPMSVESSGLLDVLVDPASGSIFIADEFRDDVRKYPLSGGSFSTIFTCATDRSPSGLALSTGDPVQPMLDCNGNAIPDSTELASGALDCDNNGFLDECQADPCPAPTFLLDNGSNAAVSNGRAVGQPSSWQIFQPFDVPPEGWTIGQVGLDGYMSNYADGSGLVIRIFPDNGSLQAPNEANELGAASLNLRFNTYNVNWQYAPLQLSLGAGRYWARIEALSPTVVAASVNPGFTGLQSRSRGSSGNFTAFTTPVALQFIEAAPTCPGDFDGDLDADSDDILAFFAAWDTGDLAADMDADSDTDSDDIIVFFTSWDAGC